MIWAIEHCFKSKEHCGSLSGFIVPSYHAAVGLIAKNNQSILWCSQSSIPLLGMKLVTVCRVEQPVEDIASLWGTSEGDKEDSPEEDLKHVFGV